MPDFTPAILLVEDEEDDVQFVRRALKQPGIINPVVVIPDVDSAKAYFRRAAAATELPVLVILDIYLTRGASGLDLLTWMRKQEELTAVPVIVLTVSTDRTEETRASGSQAASFLRKPITPEALIDAIAGLNVEETPTHVGRKKGVVLRSTRP